MAGAHRRHALGARGCPVLESSKTLIFDNLLAIEKTVGEWGRNPAGPELDAGQELSLPAPDPDNAAATACGAKQSTGVGARQFSEADERRFDGCGRTHSGLRIRVRRGSRWPLFMARIRRRRGLVRTTARDAVPPIDSAERACAKRIAAYVLALRLAEPCSACASNEADADACAGIRKDGVVHVEAGLLRGHRSGAACLHGRAVCGSAGLGAQVQ